MQETVRNAAVERLSRIISDSGNKDNNKNAQPRRTALSIHLRLEEGWFSLILVATVIYSTVWSVQAAGWVDHLNVLSLTTLVGLVVGVVAAKQQRLPRLAVHLVAVLFGLLLAYWQTAGAFYEGNTAAMTTGVHQWLVSAFTGGTGQDDSIFLFFITALGFVLAYTSAWLVYRTRTPWLMIVANAVVLLINLSNLESGYVIFLVVFLMASLLLLLRFNLFESVKRWRRQGLRYADDLGWDVMQAGALISICILIFSWILPWGYTNEAAAQIWSANANPWVQLENTWNRLISLSGGSNPSNHGNFRDTLVLGGNPNLNNDPVFTVQSDDPSQYLASVSYDTYDGRQWLVSSTYQVPLPAYGTIYNSAALLHAVVQKVHVVNPPGEQDGYLFGASQIASANQPVTVRLSSNTSSIVAVLTKNGKLTAGQTITITSFVSSAPVDTLRTVPMPAASPRFVSSYDGQTPLSYYDPAVLSTYTRLPPNLDSRIRNIALQITAGAPTMYDKVLALESYLRSHFSYDVNVHLPSGVEPVSWFLFDSPHKGYCNYFASTMAIMARTLGIPARVVAGYTSGHNDEKHHQHIMYGTDAHSWTQVYFAGYGWINFEPSAGFSTFTRPAPGEFQSGNPISNVPGGAVTRTSAKNHLPHDPSTLDGGNNSPEAAIQNQAQVGERVAMALGSVILLILFALLFFGIWWQRLFRKYSISAQIYGRMCLLANWAGIPLRRSQTPHEYISTLSVAAPAETSTLERFEDIYVRELWADPSSPEHPRASGEVKELTSLWKRLQPQLFRYLLRHPQFLWMLPKQAGRFFQRLRMRRRARLDSLHDL
jgi:hypothetical protein